MQNNPSEGLDVLRALFMQKRFARVVELCNNLLQSEPDNPRVLEILALSLSNQQNEVQAQAVLEHAWRIAPDDPQICYNLAVTYQRTGDDARAMLRYADCLRIRPRHTDALWNYGELLRVSDHFSLAAECFEGILSEDAIYPDLYHRLAVCYAHLHRNDEARDAFDKALDGNTTFTALTHWEYALFLLEIGEYADGFEHYEHRFEASVKTSVTAHPYTLPRWQGESLAGKTLLIHGEQGLGDEIMFASVIPELVGEADRIIIACRAPLARLFAESFPQCQVLPHAVHTQPADLSKAGQIDFAVPIGSLCHYRRNTSEDFKKSSAGYLAFNQREKSRFARLLERLAPGSENEFKVGLMWGSNPAREVDWGARRAARKSIPATELQILAECEGVRFISLQNRDNGAEAAEAPGLGIIDFQDYLNDFTDTAALIANLDLVISVDTSVAHLAGALSVPCRALLMTSADWRWGRYSDTTPWYDSVRLFRQSRQGDWRSVLEAVRADILLLTDCGVEDDSADSLPAR
ncbi:MAG: hypothetical protein DHS20C01_15120 [marine bacterium B5-7]|nr:MAG: hypothetical protein DHS20C01_15120 [marine bacterium B5-7]